MKRRWKRYLLLEALVISALVILAIGIGAARIYTSPDLSGMREYWSQRLYDRSYSQLTIFEQYVVDEMSPPPTIEERHSAFREWLSDRWVIRWIIWPLGLFVIVAAPVVSRLILSKTIPPSGPS